MNTDDAAPPDATLTEISSWLLSEHGQTVDTDRLRYIREEVERIVSERVPGAFVELGCFRGAMTLWIRSVLDCLGASRPLHVYDSFRGLPDTTQEDEIILPTGAMTASQEELLATLATWHKAPPQVHAGWFNDTLPTQLPGEIAFAYIDGDLYNSTKVSLVECVPRLAPGGAIILDDYADTHANPLTLVKMAGVKLACDEYFGSPSPVEVLVGEGDLAYGRYIRPTVQ